MRYIDKTPNRAEGRQITADFLQDHCLQPNGRHENIAYDNKRDGGSRAHAFCGASGGRYRKAMILLLHTEQHGLCCYCLRKLKTAQKEGEATQITLEHIIPRSSETEADGAYYRSAPGLSSAEVEVTAVYENPAYPQHSGVQPHKVAYNNLTASCNGTFPVADTTDSENADKLLQGQCCNLKRISSPAYPVYFMHDIARRVDYTINGAIRANGSEPEHTLIETVITNTGLNCDALTDIRYMWYLLRNEPKTDITDCNHSRNKRNILLSTVLFSLPEEKYELAIRLFVKFMKNCYWDTFILYDAFHAIMKAQYP